MIHATLREDRHDPNNVEDIEEQVASFERLYHSFPHQQRGDNLMDLSRFKSLVTKKVQVLFVCEDVYDFCLGVGEDFQSYSFFHFEIVRRLISLALDRKERECELASRALAVLRAKQVVSLESLAKGFERVFELADDLELDNPHAKEYIARFVARAVVDEVLPPAFLMDKYMIKLGGECVTMARSLLSVRFSSSRLSRIWGPVALLNEVEEEDKDDVDYVQALKDEIKCILVEYLESGDMEETVVCLARLNAPHYQHELVKRAVCLSLDGKERQQSMVSTLFYELYRRNVLDSNQVKLGFQRLWEEARDLELDTPGAIDILKVYFEQAVLDGLLPARDLPA
ncbi:hypothetical protein BASA81_005368 [Batrachochytrium salamandrivorans]|nr:hypothetical protein BASA81_005368 [Batrachochytrium salamandrivorans]